MAAKLALEKAIVITKDIEEIYSAKCPFGEEQQWYGLLNNSLIEIVHQETDSDSYIATFSCPKGRSEELQELLGNLFHIQVKFLHFT